MSLTEKPHVLAVEDNSETQTLLEYLLKEGYEVTVATGVEEALEASKEHSFDLFLLDINLGEERSGIDLLHLLREESEVEDVRAIALTAYAMPGDEEELLEQGFDWYVGKPFTREELTEAVEQLLTRS